MSTLRDELVQVAAVAVQIVEAIDHPDNWTPFAISDALDAVRAERSRQLRLWGQQNRSPFEWLTILGEEYGEACRAAVEAHDWSSAPGWDFDPDYEIS